VHVIYDSLPLLESRRPGDLVVERKREIDRDDEANFEGMKKDFNKLIKACVASHGVSGKPLRFCFEIEPLKGEEQREEAEVGKRKLSIGEKYAW
jgi:hypothetical protein